MAPPYIQDVQDMIAQVRRGLQKRRTHERNVAAAQQPRYMDAKHDAPYLPILAVPEMREPNRTRAHNTRLRRQRHVPEVPA
jgi:hypothetical protein